MVAYIWNLPSHRNMTMFLLSYLQSNFGDVQPNTSPADLGFY